MEMGFNKRSVQTSDVPPRSRLYSQPPRNGGTFRCESLTSYIHRLAFAYDVSPRALIVQEILPLLNHTYCKQASLSSFNGFARRAAMSMNGTGRTAADWTKTLEYLTARSDIISLTLQPWGSGLSIRRMLRRTPAWCPICYNEWREQGLPPYQPLLWMFSSLTICVQHRRRLETQCPLCKKRQAIISTHGQPGYCTGCRMWLGTQGFLEQDIAEETYEWQQWIVKVVDELYQHITFSGPLPWTQLRLSLGTCIDVIGNASKFAHLTNISFRLVYMWLHGECSLSFEGVLRLCYGLNLSLVQLITNDQAALKETLQRSEFKHSSRPTHASPLPVNRELVLEALQRALAQEGVPLSVAQIARDVGAGGETLRRLFPQECAVLSARYRTYVQRRRQGILTQRYDEIRQVVLTLHGQGIDPSGRKVRAMLSAPHIMRSPEGRAVYHAVRRELGIEPIS